MDLAEITDINELKAMAYDQIVVAQQAQQNLGAINERISQLTVASNGSQPDLALSE